MDGENSDGVGGNRLRMVRRGVREDSDWLRVKCKGKRQQRW